MNIRKITLLFLLALAFASCEKDEEDTTPETPSTPVGPRSTVMMHPHHMWGDEAFALNNTYNINGIDVQFTEVRYYLSNFAIEAMDGTEETLDGVILIDASATDMQAIGGTDAAHLHGLNCIFGLDAIINHEDPTLAEAPLNDPGMHWGWNPDAGYKFLKVEGLHDADMDGNFEAFSIHAATDALARNIEFMIMEDLAEGSNMFHFETNYESFFSNVDFSNLNGTHGASDLTNGIADQIQQNALSID
ncbi:MAG: MbnP family protein [Bacteroidota bacterium]